MTNLNVEIFNWIHSGAGTRPVLDGLAVLFAEGGPFFVALLFVVLWFRVGERKKSALLDSTWAAGVGLAVNQAIGLFYFHPRPYMMGICKPLFPHGPETSFPSDHATLLFAVAFYLLFFRRWAACGLPLLAIAILTAWGRVYAGIHFPFDMMGSLVVGFMGAGLVELFATPLRSVDQQVMRVFAEVGCALSGRLGKLRG